MWLVSFARQYGWELQMVNLIQQGAVDFHGRAQAKEPMCPSPLLLNMSDFLVFLPNVLESLALKQSALSGVRLLLAHRACACGVWNEFTSEIIGDMPSNMKSIEDCTILICHFPGACDHGILVKIIYLKVFSLDP